MSYEFLNQCDSKPKTLAELNVGDKFIYFPTDGDDSGHGGFRGGERLFVKIEPIHPGEPYHRSFLYTCREYERDQLLSSIPLESPVLQIFGVK